MRSHLVNASAPMLDREVEVQSKIRKVSTFGRYARVVCSALFAFGLVGSAGTLLMGVFGIISPGPFTDTSLTVQQKLWALPMAAAVVGVWLAVVYQLYRLFGTLASGAIYTPENVGRVRRVGILYLVLAVLGLLVPATWAALVALGYVEPSDPPKFDRWFSWSQTVNDFVTAGIILLVSWIMDVGLYEKNHADALQRDADLVI
jgi:hypothetical protein